MIKKTILVLVSLVIIISTVLGIGCTVEGPTAQVEDVTIGISATSLLPSLVHIAQERGYFMDEGVDVEIKSYPTGKAALAATFDGEVDMGTVADTPIVSNSFERNDFAVFVTIVDSAQHAKAIARKDRNISVPQDLVGKKVATTIGTTAHYFMVTFFIMNKLDISDVEIVDLKPGEMVDAITNGEVDAIFAWEPNILKSAEILGNNAIVLPSDVGFEATINMAALDNFIESNPELLSKVLRALVKAEDFAEDNREESIDMIASRLETKREYIDGLWDGYNFRNSLAQSLIVTLEDEARWSIRSNFTDKKEIPNYLDYIYLNALEEVKPEAITIIR